MKVLLDTHILIYRETPYSTPGIPPAITKLYKVLYANNLTLMVHPLSLTQIQGDKNIPSKKMLLSKLRLCPSTPCGEDYRTDNSYTRKVGISSDQNENTDNALLYSIYNGSADFLISRDKGIQDKAKAVGIVHKVLYIKEALDVISSDGIKLSFYNASGHWFIGLQGKEALFDSRAKLGFQYINMILAKYMATGDGSISCIELTGKPDQESPRSNVWHAIMTALDKIEVEPAIKSMAFYLNRGTVVPGDKFKYIPANTHKISWKTSR